MSIAAPPSVTVPFAVSGPRTDIPVPSQIDTPTPAAASFETGFPSLTMISRQTGGTPPSGMDMNGVLYKLSAHTAWLAAGGQYVFNAAFLTQYTGYGVGSILQSAADPTQFFYNTLADNANDPDSDATGWVKFSPLSLPTSTQAQAIPAGSQTVSVTGTTGFLDLSPSAGAASITDLLGGFIGQTITVTNLDPVNPLTLVAGASIRMPANLDLLQNGSITLRRRTLSQWVATS